ncbi:hypothetical protein FS837_002666 [Tulasnella sp. UAMH 9824]|nr:hypothetical protein FS837_002666 [Tulasnella sp. UAMH 9824]
MDELYMLRQGSGPGNSQQFPKIIRYANENELLAKLQLTQHPPAIILQSDAPSAGVTQTAKNETFISTMGAQSVRGEVRLEAVASTPRNEKGALIIQAFFRRCGRRAGGPIAAAYEQLIRKLGENQLDPNLRLCLRGPLPHVLEYLQTLKAASDSAIDSWKREMRNSSNEALDDLHIKGLELREIRDATNLIIEDLQPSSGLYLDLSSNSPLSVLEIVEKVRRIPGLITNIRKFANCPEDSDYNLGVEPLLSDRVSWAPEPLP